MMKPYLYQSCIALLLVYGATACDEEEEEPNVDWTQEEFYTPQTDELASDSVVLEVADGDFANREEAVEDLASRLGLTPYPTGRGDSLPESEVPELSFRIVAAEVNEAGEFVGYRSGLTEDQIVSRYGGGEPQEWMYQSGRYIFRIQESDVHRFVSIAEKLSERTVVDARGDRFDVANESSARLYVNDEQIIEDATGLKRTRLTFTGQVEDLTTQYPDFPLPTGTVVLTDYRYDTVLADSLDDGAINEPRVRILLSVSEVRQ